MKLERDKILVYGTEYYTITANETLTHMGRSTTYFISVITVVQKESVFYFGHTNLERKRRRPFYFNHTSLEKKTSATFLCILSIGDHVYLISVIQMRENERRRPFYVFCHTNLERLRTYIGHHVSNKCREKTWPWATMHTLFLSYNTKGFLYFISIIQIESITCACKLLALWVTNLSQNAIKLGLHD